MKKGVHYEKKTAELVSKFNPTAQVVHGVRVKGKLSDVLREIDVHLVDPSNYDQIIFECKDHKAKVDIELVEALCGKLSDLGAKKGAIVSNSGFTKGATSRAKASGVGLLTLVDTGDDKIRTQVFAPNIIEDRYVSSAQVRMNGIQGFFRLDPAINNILLKTDAGVVPYSEVLARHWNETGMKKPKVGENTLTLNNATIIDFDGREIIVTEFTIVYNVEERYLLRNLRLIETQGIYDVAKQTFQTNSLATERIVVQDFSDPDKWEKIEKETAESMSVPFRLVCSTPLPTMADKEL